MRPRTTVLQYLEDSARRAPEACAVEDRMESLTYAGLLDASRRAGTALMGEGACGRPVMVMAEKGARTLAAMLGVLQAGGCYVPIDPEVPAERLRSIHQTLGRPAVVADACCAQRLGEILPEAKAIPLAGLFGGVADDDLLAAARSRVIDADPAYVLFTSGSTGTPKGVVVSHRAILDFIDSFVDSFGIVASDRLANQAPFDFDVSVKDIYGTLCAGATLVVVPRALFSRPAALAAFLVERRVTVMVWAVSALCLMTTLHALDGCDLSSVRLVMFSGEVMPEKHLHLWMGALPEATFVNLYGPTEITRNCLYHVVDRRREYPGELPLGRAFANREVLLVTDGGVRVTEPGQVGEICVRGSSLANGYAADPVQTARAFGQNPLNALCADLVYHTGDYAEVGADGDLYYRGRRDNQVKYQGHRIELEEVDRAVEGQDGVDRCRCAYEPVRRRLVAFYEGTAEASGLIRSMRGLLPRFMVPTRAVRVDALPLTKNGKVDRHLLAEWARGRVSGPARDSHVQEGEVHD